MKELFSDRMIVAMQLVAGVVLIIAGLTGRTFPWPVYFLLGLFFLVVAVMKFRG